MIQTGVNVISLYNEEFEYLFSICDTVQSTLSLSKYALLLYTEAIKVSVECRTSLEWSLDIELSRCVINVHNALMSTDLYTY